MLKLSIILGTLFSASVYAGCCTTPTGVCCMSGCAKYCTNFLPEKDLTKLLEAVNKGAQPITLSSAKSK